MTTTNTITAVKVFDSILSGRKYFQITYQIQDGTWHQYYRCFKDPKDARRVAKSILESQSFNLSTSGGVN